MVGPLVLGYCDISLSCMRQAAPRRSPPDSPDVARWRRTRFEADRFELPGIDIRMVRDQLVVDDFAVPSPNPDLEHRPPGMAVGTLANEADPEETGTIGFLDPAPQFEQPRIRIIGQGSAETDMPLAVAERSIPADYRLAGSRERLWHGEEAQNDGDRQQTHADSVGRRASRRKASGPDEPSLCRLMFV